MGAGMSGTEGPVVEKDAQRLRSSMTTPMAFREFFESHTASTQNYSTKRRLCVECSRTAENWLEQENLGTRQAEFVTWKDSTAVWPKE